MFGRKNKAAPPSPAGSDSDISLMSDSDTSLEAERQKLHSELRSAAGADPFDLASLWAEVDQDELERIAVSIARNAVTVNPGGNSEDNEAAARLNISAGALEKAEVHDMADPLGYGRIDAHLLTLSREDHAGSKLRHGGMLDAGRRPDTIAGIRGHGSSSSAGKAQPSLLLRSKVLPGSEQFDAELYLGTIHAKTQLADLLQGLQNLRQQSSEHTGQLKSLVKENFDRFISSKNTIDTIYEKLQKAEAEGEAGVNGTSTQEVMASVLQVQEEAQRAFGSLLDRQTKADRIRLVLSVMKRYEAIIQLPSHVLQHAEAGNYEQVVADYRKAKALLGDQGLGSSPGQQQKGSLWWKLMTEIDKVMSSAAHTLETAVRSVQSSPAEAFDAMKHLLQLKAVGVPAAQCMDPIGLYVESQERHVCSMLEAQLHRYNARLEALWRQQQSSVEFEAQAASLASLGIGPAPAAFGREAPQSISNASSAAVTPLGTGGKAGSEVLASAMEAAALRYVACITSGVCQWLPEFWIVTQLRLPALTSIDKAAAVAVERGMAAAEHSVGILLRKYHSALKSVVAGKEGPDISHTGMLSIASELASGYQVLSMAAPSSSTPMPAAVLECLQEMTEAAVLSSLAALTAYLAREIERLFAAEDFRLAPASRTGAPATGCVAALQQLLQQGMLHFKAVLAEAARAQVDILRKSAAPVCDAFLACFRAFAAGTEAVAASLLGDEQAGHSSSTAAAGYQSLAAEAAAAGGRAGGGPREQAVPSSMRRLLVLCANLIAVRGQLLPQQYSRWAALLQSASIVRQLHATAEACGKDLEDVETRLAGKYVFAKQAVLDDIMEQMLFTDGTAWESAALPIELRPVVLELVHSLLAVEAELVSVAPVLLNDALEELLLGILNGCALVVSQGNPAASLGGVAQLKLEANFLLAAMSGMRSQPLQEATRRLQTALRLRLEAALSTVTSAGGPELDELTVWLRDCSAPGQPPSVPIIERRLASICEVAVAGAQANLSPLQQLLLGDQ